MNWFTNLTSAIGGNSNGGSNSAPSGSNNGTANPGSDSSSSVPVHTYDNAGNPVKNSSSDSQSAPPTNQPQANQSANNGQSADIESLLFGEPEANQNNQNANQANQNPNNQNANSNPTEPEIAPGFTNSQLINNIKSVNFASAITPELAQAALGGDAQAFSQALNNIAQISAAIAVQQSAAISRQMMESQKAEWDNQFSSKFSDNQFSSITADPKYSNPFIKPMVDNIVNQMRKRDPSITPDQVRSALPKLLDHAIKSVNIGNTPMPAANQPNTRTQPNTVNYDDLF